MDRDSELESLQCYPFHLPEFDRTTQKVGTGLDMKVVPTGIYLFEHRARSLRGKYAWVATSSEAFAERKQEELELSEGKEGGDDDLD